MLFKDFSTSIYLCITYMVSCENHLNKRSNLSEAKTTLKNHSLLNTYISRNLS